MISTTVLESASHIRTGGTGMFSDELFSATLVTLYLTKHDFPCSLSCLVDLFYVIQC